MSYSCVLRARSCPYRFLPQDEHLHPAPRDVQHTSCLPAWSGPDLPFGCAGSELVDSLPGVGNNPIIVEKHAIRVVVSRQIHRPTGEFRWTEVTLGYQVGSARRIEKYFTGSGIRYCKNPTQFGVITGAAPVDLDKIAAQHGKQASGCGIESWRCPNFPSN